MPTLLRRNYFITNLKTSHSTRVSLKFIVNTQFFNIRACFCWPQMARGIVSCGFGDQDCKLLDFQIKPCETNHCKPRKSCWFFSFSFLENVHSIETRRCRSRGADGAALTGCVRSSSSLWASLVPPGQERRSQVSPAPSQPFCFNLCYTFRSSGWMLCY